MKLRYLVRAAVIGAVYAAVTLVLAPISYGPLQFRISEALCVLPWFFPEAVPGLAAGCLLANLIGGNGVLDVIFGTLATLLAALCTLWLRKTGRRWLGCIPPIVFNGVIVGAVLAYVLAPKEEFLHFWLIFGLEVAGGEAAVLFVLGLPLLLLLPRLLSRLQKTDTER